nr:stromal 70 kda heat shock-related protein, chloroplastic [Quercus suber]
MPSSLIRLETTFKLGIQLKYLKYIDFNRLLNQIGEFLGIFPNKENISSTPTDEFSDHLWIFSLSNNELQNRLNKSNPSEQNYVELPSPSATHSCGSSSVPLLPTSSCGTDMDQWAFNNGRDSRHRPRRNHRPPPYARRPQKHYLSHFGWLRIRFRLWKRSSRPTRIPTATLMSRALIRELEEIDPSFNLSSKDKQALCLTESADKVKMELSSLTQTNISLPFITTAANGPKHIDTTLTRVKFEELC